MSRIQKIASDNSWKALSQFTEARIALGRTGQSLTTEKSLSFSMAHAMARDSIYQPFEKNNLEQELLAMQLDVMRLQSKATDKKEFLLRPDLGRKLNEKSCLITSEQRVETSFDICINISDGLSALAVNKHALPLLKILIPLINNARFSLAPVCIIENGRVAISDETGFLLQAKISLILIGERPGLTANDSMGAYLTYQPKADNTDAQRNCISNIRKGGLGYEEAADEIMTLIKASMQNKMSGTTLKSLLSLPERQ